MNTELFGAPLLALAMDAYAQTEAKMDATDIAEGRPIQHGEGWFRRVGVSLIAIAIVFFCVMPHTWTSIAACALVAYGWWMPVFRWRLNGLRKLKACYVSPSNAYDWLFIDLTLGWVIKGPRRREMAIEEHQHGYFSGLFPLYRRNIHRAGTLAYAVELSSLAIGIFLYYHQL